jgi:hypothetical protein
MKMDPEWNHAYLSLKLRKFYPITSKIDHTKYKTFPASSIPKVWFDSPWQNKHVKENHRTCDIYKTTSYTQTDDHV